MPIKPENRARYPKDWQQIRFAVLTRAEHKCEGSPDYPHCRVRNGEPHPETGSRVVLTIAHLDHIPEHCEMDNLRAWCQRCHLHYDRHHHAANSYETRRKGKADGDLFNDDGPGEEDGPWSEGWESRTPPQGQGEK